MCLLLMPPNLDSVTRPCRDTAAVQQEKPCTKTGVPAKDHYVAVASQCARAAATSPQPADVHLYPGRNQRNLMNCASEAFLFED